MKRLFLISVASLSLFGCGGGGGTSSPGGSSVVSGKVADGYIQGATVFWDCNKNKLLDNSEINAKTGKGGAFEIASAPSTDCSLVATVPIGAIDEDAPNTPIASAYTLVSTKGNETFISPLSTLVATHMDNNPTASQSDAETAVATMLGVTGNLNSDYIAVQVAENVKKKGVAKVIATVLQANHISGTPSVGASNAYAKVQSIAPSIGSVDFSNNSAIDDFLNHNSLKGFIKLSEFVAFDSTESYAARPVSSLNLTESQLTTLDSIVAAANNKSAIRHGVVKFNEFDYNELIKIQSDLVTAGLIAGSSDPAVAKIKKQRDDTTAYLSAYYSANLKDKNTFFNNNIAANVNYITRVSIDGLDAVSGAVSMATNAPSIDLRKFKSRPKLKNAIKAVRQYKLGEVAGALLSGLNSAGGQLSAGNQAVINKFIISDGSNLTQEDYLALAELLNSIVDIGKDAIKNSKLEKFAKVFSGALTLYNGFAADCTTATADCVYSGLEVLESMSEWVDAPTRMQGTLQWMRSTVDAYIAGKEYDAITAGAVAIEQDKVLSDWNARQARVLKFWLLQELGVAGIDKLFEAYDPTIPCAANQARKHGVCINQFSVTVSANTLTPVVGDEVTFTANVSASNSPVKSYSWSFGDGSKSLGNNENTIKHKFFYAYGTYAVFVNVEYQSGAQVKSPDIFITPSGVLQKTPFIAAQILALNQVIDVQSSEAAYLLGNTMTRAQAAKLAADMGGYTATECSGKVYQDVNSTLGEYCGYIEAIAQAGMWSTKTTSFYPAQSITRAEILKLLVNAVGETASVNDAPFSDNLPVTTDLRFYINRAYELGCSYSSGMFYPNNPVLRGDAFKFSVCLAQLW